MLLAEAFALGIVVLLARQMLMWLALRELAPGIVHRMELPDGLRIREPMRFGIVYRLARWAGWIGLAFLIAPVLHLLLLGFDQGWTLQLRTMLCAVAGVAAALFVLDWLVASRVRGATRLPADWRARVS
ncbi:hypothetical protein [Sphingomonas sp. Root241]|uniref:hypothetical protein n=1 Tax=Sphingomonas sp. Root241 TaxID=1736501 RepID=UPI00138F5F63|nr:hypothetical protein [Sphingomonas sp. Root241]